MAEKPSKLDKPTSRKSHDSKTSSENTTERFVLPDPLRLLITYICIDRLKGYKRHTRRYTKKQLKKLQDGINEFGFVVPVLVDHDKTVIAGHARIMVAKRLGITEVPVIELGHLSDAQVRAFRIFDNRISEEGDWDPYNLALEFQHLVEVNFDVTLTGFEMPEIDLVINSQIAPIGMMPEDQFQVPEPECRPVSRIGDLWLLDEHRVLCGDARIKAFYQKLMGNSCLAQQVVTDGPYNVSVRNHVRVSNKKGFREFLMASGEMSDEQFDDFLDPVMENLVRFSEDGSVHHLFMDWRHLALMTAVCQRHFNRQLNLCVWVKSNGGMGSLYRSQHEVILVYKNGTLPHINNVELGTHGRNRTNIWQYQGVNSFGSERQQNLDAHPTPKPVAMIADAILDCSTRGGIILDPFLGSGTLIIAAEKTGRVGFGMELDPQYIDVTVRRWQDFTGGVAVHADTGMTFEEMTAVRNAPIPLLPAPHQDTKKGEMTK
jgi:DNA modification methylase